MSQDLVRERAFAREQQARGLFATTRPDREPEVGDVVYHTEHDMTGEVIEVQGHGVFAVREIVTGALLHWFRHLVRFPLPGSIVSARGTIEGREIRGVYIGRSRFRGETLIRTHRRVVPVLTATLQVIEEPHVV